MRKACHIDWQRAHSSPAKTKVPLAFASRVGYKFLSRIAVPDASHAGLMSFDKFVDVDTLNNERRKAIAKSIRTISVDELKKLAEEIFDEPDRPWRQTFLSLIAENPGATFYHASAGEGVIFLYSRDNDKGCGIWPVAA